MLSVSEGSIDWWEDNPGEGYVLMGLPAWAAYDIIGGCFGACWAGVANASWASIGWAALGAGAAASCGLVKGVANTLGYK